MTRFSRFSMSVYLATLPVRNALHVFTAPLRRLGEWLFGWLDGLGMIDEITCDCGRHSTRRVITVDPSDELVIRRSLCALCDLCGQSEPRPSEPGARATG